MQRGEESDRKWIAIQLSEHVMILKCFHQAGTTLKVVHNLGMDIFMMRDLAELLLRDSHAEFLVINWEMFIHQH